MHTFIIVSIHFVDLSYLRVYYVDQIWSAALTTGLCQLLGQPPTATYKLGQLPSQPVSAGCLVIFPQLHKSWIGCPHNQSLLLVRKVDQATGLCQLLGQPPTATYKLGRLPSQPVSTSCLVSLPQLHTSWVGCPHNRSLPVAWSASHSYIQAGSAALTTGLCQLLGQPFTATYKLGRLPSQPVSVALTLISILLQLHNS